MGRELIINAKRGREVNTTEYFPHLLKTSGKRNLKKAILRHICTCKEIDPKSCCLGSEVKKGSP